MKFEYVIFVKGVALATPGYPIICQILYLKLNILVPLPSGNEFSFERRNFGSEPHIV